MFVKINLVLEAVAVNGLGLLTAASHARIGK